MRDDINDGYLAGQMFGLGDSEAMGIAGEFQGTLYSIHQASYYIQIRGVLIAEGI